MIITNATNVTEDVSNSIGVKPERHAIFARWLVDAYDTERLSRGACGNGAISRTLADAGVRSTDEDGGDGAPDPPFGVITLSTPPLIGRTVRGP